MGSRVLVAAAGAWLSIVANSVAGAASPLAIAHQRYKLPNGLTVVLAEDHRAPRVAVSVWYRVGPIDEAPGRSGFAHLFEHLMFAGSTHTGEGQHTRLLEAAGATDCNAITEFDHTRYFETVPSSEVALALWLESDRMGFLRVTPARLESERATVNNERRRTDESTPYGRSDEALVGALYPAAHPYHGDVIGSHEDIDAATLDEVSSFHCANYGPAHATLVLAGDFQAADARRLVQRYFATLPTAPCAGSASETRALFSPTASSSGSPSSSPSSPRSSSAPSSTSPSPPSLPSPSGLPSGYATASLRPARRPLAVPPAARRIVVEEPVALGRVIIGFVTPPAFAPDEAEVDLGTRILGEGRASRLYRKLVRQSQLASSVSCHHEPLALGSYDTCEATARLGVSLEKLEAALGAGIAELVDSGANEREIEQARNGLEAGLVAQLDSLGGVGGKADVLGYYDVYRDDPGYLVEDMARYRRIAPESLRSALHRHFDLRHAVTVVTRPRQGPMKSPTTAPSLPATTRSTEATNAATTAPVPTAQVDLSSVASVDPIAPSSRPHDASEAQTTTLARTAIASAGQEQRGKRGRSGTAKSRGTAKSQAERASDAFRRHRPAAAHPPVLQLPHVTEIRMANGLRVWLLERHDLPFVVARAIFRAGDQAQPPGRDGLAALTAELLQMGSRGADGFLHDAQAIAESLARLGAQLDTGTTREAAFVELSVLKTKLQPAFERFAEILLRPELADAEFSRARAQQLADVAHALRDPALAMTEVIPAAVYGSRHPYGTRHLGTRESVAALAPAEVVAFYRSHYRLDEAVLILVGDVDSLEARRLVSSSGLDRVEPGVKETATHIPPPAPEFAGQSVVVIDTAAAQEGSGRDDGVEAEIGFALATVPRQHPSYLPLLVGVVCLGGSDTSRLFLRLREERGYTYGIDAHVEPTSGPSLVFATGGVRREATFLALAELRRELLRLVDEPPTIREVGLARAQLIHGISGQLATMREGAALLSSWFLHGYLPAQLPSLLGQLGAITPGEVARALRAHLHPTEARFFVASGSALPPLTASPLAPLAGSGFPFLRVDVDSEGRQRSKP